MVSGSVFIIEVTYGGKAAKIRGRETFLSVSNLSCDACWVLFHLLFRKVEKNEIQYNTVKVNVRHEPRLGLFVSTETPKIKIQLCIILYVGIKLSFTVDTLIIYHLCSQHLP